MSDTDTTSDSSIDLATTDEHGHPFTTVEAIEEYDWSNFDLQTAETSTTRPHRDPWILVYCYWVNEDSQRDIAERYDVTQPTIGNQMEKQGIPRRKHPRNCDAVVGYSIDGGNRGVYPRVYSNYDTEVDRTAVHRLLACVDNDPHDVYGDNDLQVDHETGHPLDNRPEAIQLVDSSEHQRLHHSERAGWVVEDGEPRHRFDPDEDAVDPADEWWHPTEDGEYLPDDGDGLKDGSEE